MAASIIGAEAKEAMRNTQPNVRTRKPAVAPSEDLASQLARKIVGQTAATETIVPYVQMFQAGLAPEGRPVGVFLLLGPTGTGKTKTVEALAEVLHGSEKSLLKVDCGEFQMEHEVAKLIGAPPGYLGHRETQPILTQQKLQSVVSEKCGLAIVLFDEIEKAAPSMTRLLLGVLDKGILRLGDNATVNFEKTLVFLTSNLGAGEMMKEINPDFGFQSGVARERADLTGKLQSIGLTAVRKKFSPEFVNRIDQVITYHPLTGESLSTILDMQIAQLQKHVNTRLGARQFRLIVPEAAREKLLELGTSAQYGARELNRTIHRKLTQPIAALVATGQVDPGAAVYVDAEGGDLNIRVVSPENSREAATPTVLVVDDNRDLVRFLDRYMLQSGWRLVTAPSARKALEVAALERPDAALVDYLLPDENGVKLGAELRLINPAMSVLIMSGLDLSNEEQTFCDKADFVMLRKPFLASEILAQIQKRLS